ncbi:hypothetical protein [Lysobacter olei]
MSMLSRWIAPAVLATGLGVAGLSPAPAQAQSANDWARVIVDVADVIYRSGQPYYRYGNYGYDDRLVVVRDRYGRPTYYRNVPRDYRAGPPYGRAHGYWRNGPGSREAVRCDSRGRCTAKYYDERYDRRYDNRYYGDRYDHRDRYWDGYRWRDR